MRANGPAARALVVLLVLSGLTPSIGEARALPPGCGPLIERPAIGLSCAVPGGYQVPVGTGWLFTHGPDPVPEIEYSKIPFVSRRRPSCATRPDVEFHARLLYVRPHDRPNRFGRMAPQVVAMVEQVNAWLYTNARRRDRKLDMRVLCSGGRVSVRHVVTQTDLEDTSFSTVVNDLFAQGYNDPLAKYWIWFDGRFTGAPGGQGSFANDDSPSATNRSNLGGQYAITWGIPGAGGASVMMHENGHNMGAVATSAPRTTGAGHCVDGEDVMCYNDRGAYAAKYDRARCDLPYYDCGYDDYFNPRPRRGSYIARHWNIGSPVNRFVAGCMYRNEILTAPAPADDPEARLDEVSDASPQDPGIDPLRIFSRAHSVPRSCWSRPFAASAILRPPTSYASISDSLATGVVNFAFAFVPAAVAADVDVCWYKRSRLLRCHGSGMAEVGTVPRGATKVRVIARKQAPLVYALNAV